MKKQKLILLAVIILLCFIVISVMINQKRNIKKEQIIIKEMSETTQVSDLQEQINQLNASNTEYANYVQSCKQAIARAITNQGVETSEDSKIDTIIENIEKMATNKYNEGYTTCASEKPKTNLTLLTTVSGNRNIRSTTVNVQELLENYSELTKDDFIICPTIISAGSGGDWNVNVSMSPSWSYNATTGVLTISGIGAYNSQTYNNEVRATHSISATFNVYVL